MDKTDLFMEQASHAWTYDSSRDSRTFPTYSLNHKRWNLMMKADDNTMRDPIDAVILWVDGDDPVWKAKCDAARGGNTLTRRDDIGGDLR
ncbi:MAG: Stealth CR1 domain-containing protein, partial [Muribaculaceae bacterium]|nr:Stealth CR1 domain-containing protein [Muribaculaceae bacterium]